MPTMHYTTDQPLTLSVELDLRGDGTWVTYDRFAVDGYRFMSVSEVPPAQSSTSACAASADGTPGGRGPV